MSNVRQYLVTMREVHESFRYVTASTDANAHEIVSLAYDTEEDSSRFLEIVDDHNEEYAHLIDGESMSLYGNQSDDPKQRAPIPPLDIVKHQRNLAIKTMDDVMKEVASAWKSAGSNSKIILSDRAEVLALLNDWSRVTHIIATEDERLDGEYQTY